MLLKVLKKYGMFLIIGSYVGVSYAESPWSLNLGITSLYLDSPGHGFQEEGLDAMAMDYAVVYRFNETVSLKAGVAQSFESFAKNDEGDESSVSMPYVDVQFGYDNGAIRPYVFFGLAELDVSPEEGSVQTSRRLGFGVEHELFDNWSIEVNYSLISASVKDAESESSTTVGLSYRFD